MGVAGLLVFGLGYSAGRVLSIGDLARFARDVDTDRYTLEHPGASVQVHFERLGGAGKPYLRTLDGAELMDVSDWDTNSRISVDDSRFDLVRVYPRSAADYGRFRAAETLLGTGWELGREMSLEGDGSVLIEHTFVARRSVKHVEVTLAHLFVHGTSATIDGSTVRADVLPSLGIGPGIMGMHKYQVSLESVAGSPPMTVQRAVRPNGLSIVGTLTADDPPQDQRVILARVRIRVDADQ